MAKTAVLYDVILNESYASKQIIDVLKEKLGFDNEKAKSFVENPQRPVLEKATSTKAKELKAELEKLGAKVFMGKHGAYNEYYTKCVYSINVRSFGDNKPAVIKALVANGYNAEKAEKLYQSKTYSGQVDEREKERLINEAKMLMKAGADLVVYQQVYSYYSQSIEVTQEDTAPDVDTLQYSVCLYPPTSPESIVEVLQQLPVTKKNTDKIMKAKRWTFAFDQKNRGDLEAANDLFKVLKAGNADVVLTKRRVVVIPMEPVKVEEEKQSETKKKEDLTDLLPIKGISVAMKKALNKKCNIYDIPGLLCRGVTLADRQKIAKTLGINDTRYVTLWLKQADLWRIPNMNSNLAYLAVLAGIRHVDDYAKADSKKLMTVFKTLVATHPDLECPTEKDLERSLKYAKVFVDGLTENSYVLNVDEEDKPDRLFLDGIDESQL